MSHFSVNLGEFVVKLLKKILKLIPSRNKSNGKNSGVLIDSEKSEIMISRDFSELDLNTIVQKNPDVVKHIESFKKVPELLDEISVGRKEMRNIMGGEGNMKTSDLFHADHCRKSIKDKMDTLQKLFEFSKKDSSVIIKYLNALEYDIMKSESGISELKKVYGKGELPPEDYENLLTTRRKINKDLVKTKKMVEKGLNEINEIFSCKM